jgi:hypothetical protein
MTCHEECQQYRDFNLAKARQLRIKLQGLKGHERDFWEKELNEAVKQALRFYGALGEVDHS